MSGLFFVVSAINTDARTTCMLKKSDSTNGAPQLRPEPFGATRRSLEVDGISYREVVHVPNQSHPAHYHENAMLACILKGSSEEITKKGTFESHTGGIVLMPAGEVHSNRYPKGGCKSLVLEIEQARLEAFGSSFRGLDEFSYQRSPLISALSARIYSEILFMDPASPLAVEGLTLELFSELFRTVSRHPGDRRKPRWLYEVNDFINSHFRESMSLMELARMSGVHPVHLAREYRKFFRCTIGERIRRLRIEFAVDVLTRSDSRLAEIALMAGFSDQAHFTRIFKSQTGLTPSQFRYLHGAARSPRRNKGDRSST